MKCYTKKKSNKPPFLLVNNKLIQINKFYVFFLLYFQINFFFNTNQENKYPDPTKTEECKNVCHNQGSGLIALKYVLIYNPINLKLCTKYEKKYLKIIKERIHFI